MRGLLRAEEEAGHRGPACGRIRWEIQGWETGHRPPRGPFVGRDGVRAAAREALGQALGPAASLLHALSYSGGQCSRRPPPARGPVPVSLPSCDAPPGEGRGHVRTARPLSGTLGATGPHCVVPLRSDSHSDSHRRDAPKAAWPSSQQRRNATRPLEGSQAPRLPGHAVLAPGLPSAVTDKRSALQPAGSPLSPTPRLAEDRALGTVAPVPRPCVLRVPVAPWSVPREHHGARRPPRRPTPRPLLSGRARPLPLPAAPSAAPRRSPSPSRALPGRRGAGSSPRAPPAPAAPIASVPHAGARRFDPRPRPLSRGRAGAPDAPLLPGWIPADDGHLGVPQPDPQCPARPRPLWPGAAEPRPVWCPQEG